MGGFTQLMAPVPEPVTPLGRLRLLSPHAAIRMSALQLGGLSLGSSWSDYNAPMSKEDGFALLDAFVAAGGCSIDTANHYQDEESEKIIGEWMTARDNRDRLVLATKFTSCFQAHEYGKNESANSSGNSRKSAHVSLKHSLKKLQTDYIDILYIHFWDHTTSVEELMDTLDIFVKQGKVLYLGVSNVPAWVISACNTYAKATNKTPFTIVQTKWNVMERDIERDLLPMARAYGMAIAPWGALAQGRLQSKAQMEKLQKEGKFRKGFKGDQQTDEEVKYSMALAKMGEKRGIDSVAPMALAYLFAKYPLVFPVVGLQSSEQLNDNIKALTVNLTAEEVAELDAIKPLDVGFPNSMIGPDPRISGKAAGVNAGQLGSIDWLTYTGRYSSQLQ